VSVLEKTAGATPGGMVYYKSGSCRVFTRNPRMPPVESSQLIIHMSRAYGSLNRLIGIVRQRCFEVESMTVQSESADHYRIEMVVISERNIVHLLKKISQMADVSSVSAAKLTRVLETA
jgi:acetolactate synthase regulatory subunit